MASPVESINSHASRIAGRLAQLCAVQSPDSPLKIGTNSSSPGHTSPATSTPHNCSFSSPASAALLHSPGSFQAAVRSLESSRALEQQRTDAAVQLQRARQRALDQAQQLIDRIQAVQAAQSRSATEQQASVMAGLREDADRAHARADALSCELQAAQARETALESEVASLRDQLLAAQRHASQLRSLPEHLRQVQHALQNVASQQSVTEQAVRELCARSQPASSPTLAAEVAAAACDAALGRYSAKP